MHLGLSQISLHAELCARDLAHLGRHASSRLRLMQRRSSLVMAFWKQAELF
jgi:hypothetical protein